MPLPMLQIFPNISMKALSFFKKDNCAFKWLKWYEPLYGRVSNNVVFYFINFMGFLINTQKKNIFTNRTGQ